METARSASVSHWLGLVAILFVAAFLNACAPVQQGNDQCKDANVNLVALKDAKYQTLPESAGGLSPAMRAAVDQAVTNWMASKQVPVAGCAIAITRNNQIAYLQAYGKADVAANRPFTIATPCAIGSISKTLTALGLMALVEDGKLNLDAPLLDQMGLTPGVDVGWTHNPTLREVLAHKGGFIEGAPVWDPAAFHNGPTMSAAFPNIPFPSLQPLLVFQGYKTKAANQVEPGNPTYSNVGYSVAGALLDYRTKQNDIPSYMRGYESYIWHRVARGSQLSEPTMITACLATDFRATDIKNLAKGYAQDGSGLSFGDSTSVGWGWEGPAGGWAMTIGDLGRLMLILQSDAVISKSVIDSEMRQSYGQLFSNGTRAGLGLELAGPGDGGWFGKGGDILGYTADMKIWPGFSSCPSCASSPSWGVAFVCNQKYAGKSLTGQLHEPPDNSRRGFLRRHPTGRTARSHCQTCRTVRAVCAQLRRTIPGASENAGGRLAPGETGSRSISKRESAGGNVGTR